VTLLDITSVEEIHSNYLEEEMEFGKLINFEKFKLLENSLSNFFKFQKWPHSERRVDVDNALNTVLQVLPVVSENSLMELSLLIEPREVKTNK